MASGASLPGMATLSEAQLLAKTFGTLSAIFFPIVDSRATTALMLMASRVSLMVI